MNKLYAWRTLDIAPLIESIYYSYSDIESSSDIADWNAKHEDLYIKVAINKFDKNLLYDIYLVEGESAAFVISWKGDRRFSGISEMYISDHLNESFSIECKVPKGFCLSSFTADLSIVIHRPIENGEGVWYRPPGSIIATFPIKEGLKLGKGDLFPLIETEGDGTDLIRWDFYNIDDIEISVMSGLVAVIDTKHPIAANKVKNSDSNTLLLLTIIQSYIQKSFNETIFNQLIERNTEKNPWPPGSIGGSYNNILKKLCNLCGQRSFTELRNLYHAKPELINQSISRLFLNTLIR